MQEIYLLTIVISLASGLAILVKRFRQPLLVSYVVVGALLSAFHVVKPEELEFLAFLPEIGLAFLLFLVGMELDLREFRSLGKNVLLATLGQVVATTALLLVGLTFFGLSYAQAAMVGLAVSFSSTILVIKLLLENKELSSMHGKLSVGVLLVEDLLAVVMLMVMTILTQSGASFNPLTIGLVVLKGAGLIWLALFLGRRVLPKVFTYTAESSELLFLTAIGWCLLFVSITLSLGFSLAIGAFLAGISLAQSVYRVQISGRIKPLRDFFIMLFFIDLGTGLSISGIRENVGLAVSLLLYAVVFKPLVFFLLFTRLRLRAHSAFQTSIYLSSVSEFSLIVLAQGLQTNLLPASIFSPAIFATVLSFTLSSFLVTHSQALYQKLRKLLKFFESKETFNLEGTEHKVEELEDHAILIGCHRSGAIILRALRRVFGEKLIVVDFNPDIIGELRDQFVKCLYGDISDPEIQEQLAFEKAKLVVSTVRDLESNLSLLDYLEKIQSKALIIVTAADAGEAIKLYERGAHHVSLPLTLEGSNLSHLITDHQGNFRHLATERERKLGELKRLVNS